MKSELKIISQYQIEYYPDLNNFALFSLQEEEWARQEALRIQQQEDEEAAKRAALQPPPASDQRYDLPPEVCSIRKQILETGT